jgi:putative oxidoreductase
MLNTINNKLVTIATRSQTISLELMRIISGIVLVFGFGYVKLFGENPQPFLGGKDIFGIDLGINMLWLAGFIEFFSGILVTIGLFTRWAALLIAALMVMAYLASHAAWFPTFKGGELATAYFLIFFCIFAHGPGPFSLDTWLFGNKSGR